MKAYWVKSCKKYRIFTVNLCDLKFQEWHLAKNDIIAIFLCLKLKVYNLLIAKNAQLEYNTYIIHILIVF